MSMLLLLRLATYLAAGGAITLPSAASAPLTTCDLLREPDRYADAKIKLSGELTFDSHYHAAFLSSTCELASESKAVAVTMLIPIGYEQIHAKRVARLKHRYQRWTAASKKRTFRLTAVGRLQAILPNREGQYATMMGAQYRLHSYFHLSGKFTWKAR